MNLCILFVTACSLLATINCTKGQAQPLSAVPTTGNQRARQRFQKARAQFVRNQRPLDAKSSAEFEAIVRQYPNDPVAPFAQLYVGIAAYHAGEHDKAISALSGPFPARPEIHTRSQLYLGLALVAGGRDGALPALRKGQSAIASEDEQILWWAASAEASRTSGALKEAIMAYDQWAKQAQPAERVYIADRLTQIAQVLPARDLQETLSLLTANGIAVATIGGRAAAQLANEGRTDEARALRKRVAQARQAWGLETAALATDASNTKILGAILPLTGRRGQIGMAAQRALTLAAGIYEQTQQANPFTLLVKDSQSQSALAGHAALELVKANVIAAIGPVDSAAVAEAARLTHSTNLPIISLDPRAQAPTPSRLVFHIMHSAEMRASALAAWAVAQGIGDFAILGPKNGYGQAVAAAFRSEVQKQGGNVLVESSYAPTETNFKTVIAQLNKPWQAVFIPDMANRLELIAPALAAANLWSQRYNKKPNQTKPQQGRAIQILTTAEAVSEQFFQTTGRYTAGAILAPGFSVDPNDIALSKFDQQFRAELGRAPTALEAYTFDAATVLQSAVEQGAKDCNAVARFIATQNTSGLTGSLAFTANGRRQGSGLLFEVVKNGNSGSFSPRAIR